MSDKTEDPTPRRLRRAREEGDSGVSAYAGQAVAFVAAVALVPSTIRAVASRASDELHVAIDQAGSAGGRLPRFDGLELAGTVLALALPLLVAVALVGGVSQLLQTGGVLSTRRLAPRLARLDPAAGVKGIFSSARLFMVVRAILAGTAVGWIAFVGLKEHMVDLARLTGRVRWAGLVVSEAASTLAWRAALVGLALGAVDLVVTRRAWMRRLRMSKDEVKREHKEAEGDPTIKAARARAYQELLAQATIANVRTASVVVVNPTHLACALRYDEKAGDQAPVVVASGEGELAARILRAAQEWGVPVVRDVPLARALIELEVGDAIPEVLYEAVAEILREIMEGPHASGS